MTLKVELPFTLLWLLEINLISSSMNLPIIFSHHNFPEPRLTSANVLFSSIQQSETQRYSVYNKNPHTGEAVTWEPENVCHVSLCCICTYIFPLMYYMFVIALYVCILSCTSFCTCFCILLFAPYVNLFIFFVLQQEQGNTILFLNVLYFTAYTVDRWQKSLSYFILSLISYLKMTEMIDCCWFFLSIH